MVIVPASDPQLERILRTQTRLEQHRAVRILLLTILALDGAVVWIGAVRPSLAHTGGGRFALLAWPVCFAGYLLVRTLEMRAQARIEGLLARDRPEPDP